MIEDHRNAFVFGCVAGGANRENESQALILNIDVFTFPRNQPLYLGSAATQPAGTRAQDTFWALFHVTAAEVSSVPFSSGTVTEPACGWPESPQASDLCSASQLGPAATRAN